MEGPVLTESEVWKVGSGNNTSLNTSDRNIDFSPLMNDNMPDENPAAAVQQEICSNIKEQPDSDVTPDQIKSVIQHEPEDLSSQTAVRNNESSESDCVNQAADKTNLIPDQQGLNQEITILVTNHDFTFEDDGNENCEEQKTKTISSTDGQEPTEEESQDGSIVVANVIEVSQVQKASVMSNTSTEEDTSVEEPKLREDQAKTDSETGQHDTDSNSSHANTNTEPRASVEDCNLKDQTTQPQGEELNIKLKKNESTESRDASRLPQETLTLTRSPGRQQHVQTQVSLEVMYHSVATSPMTPPEGSAAFLFPSSFGKLGSKSSTDVAQTIETKDVEMQVGLLVESRSVATAPMTPIALTAPELIPEPEPRIGVTSEEMIESVQEVSWDEKGMTWEVYGAVVEVAVLGTAIQKHLEKQVKKQKQQTLTLTSPTEAPQTELMETSVPVPSSPPPISDPISADTEQSTKIEEKKNKVRRRQNPFRRWFRNVRRPSCCSRPRQDEEN